MKTFDGFYDDGWLRKIKESITQNYATFDEMERLRKMYDYRGISKHIEELLKTSVENDELIKQIAQPLSDRLSELTQSLRMPVPGVVTHEQLHTSYNAIHSANAAIADILEQRKYVEKITTQSAVDISAVSAFEDLSRYSNIGELSLAAQNMLSGMNLTDMSIITGISLENLAVLEESFLGFTDGYSALFRSIEASKVDIASLDWFVTELPPVEIFTGTSFARVVSRPSLSEEDLAQILEEDLVEDIERSLEEMLSRMDAGLLRAWHGAKQAVHSDNPDRSRHVTVSLRELLTHVLHKVAPDDKVRRWTSDPKHFQNGRVPSPLSFKKVWFRYRFRSSPSFPLFQLEIFVK